MTPDDEALYTKATLALKADHSRSPATRLSNILWRGWQAIYRRDDQHGRIESTHNHHQPGNLSTRRRECYSDLMDTDSDLDQACRRGVRRFCCITLSPVIVIAILSGWFMRSVYADPVAMLVGALVASLATLGFVWVIGMFMEMIETARSIFD